MIAIEQSTNHSSMGDAGNPVIRDRSGYRYRMPAA